MKIDSFVTAVLEKTEMVTRRDALCAIRATLKTLGEGLPASDAGMLAAQLPPPVDGYLSGSPRQVHMSLVEFLKRVGERERVYLPEAALHARAVVEAIEEMATDRGDQDMGEVLPTEWQPLVAAN